MKRFGLMLSLMLMVILTGCVMRSYQYVQDRVDQSIEGNRGYLLGTPPPVEEELPATRKMVAVEIEIPSYPEKTDTHRRGNLGYVSGKSGELPRESLSTKKVKSETKIEEEKGFVEYEKVPLPQIPEVQEKIEVQESLTEKSSREQVKTEAVIQYKVQKGDTLEKIAGRNEIYGDSKKWVEIYRANRDKLRSPDRIYPGQILKIPR